MMHEFMLYLIKDLILDSSDPLKKYAKCH